MGLCLRFFAATIVNNLFDNPVLFKNVENVFLIDIMTHNRHRCNQKQMKV